MLTKLSAGIIDKYVNLSENACSCSVMSTQGLNDELLHDPVSLTSHYNRFQDRQSQRWKRERETSSIPPDPDCSPLWN